jgi:hypothetical protein
MHANIDKDNDTCIYFCLFVFSFEKQPKDKLAKRAARFGRAFALNRRYGFVNAFAYRFEKIYA